MAAGEDPLERDLAYGLMTYCHRRQHVAVDVAPRAALFLLVAAFVAAAPEAAIDLWQQVRDQLDVSGER
jgi:hypothetical protein